MCFFILFFLICFLSSFLFSYFLDLFFTSLALFLLFTFIIVLCIFPLLLIPFQREIQQSLRHYELFYRKIRSRATTQSTSMCHIQVRLALFIVHVYLIFSLHSFVYWYLSVSHWIVVLVFSSCVLLY